MSFALPKQFRKSRSIFKMDQDFWNCFGREKPCVISEEISTSTELLGLLLNMGRRTTKLTRALLLILMFFCILGSHLTSFINFCHIPVIIHMSFNLPLSKIKMNTGSAIENQFTPNLICLIIHQSFNYHLSEIKVTTSSVIRNQFTPYLIPLIIHQSFNYHLSKIKVNTGSVIRFTH